MKIYDCFQFFNELDLLEIRLELLYDIVDYFVIAEANQTHANHQKPSYFLENKHLFEKYMDKIIHVKDDFPSNIGNVLLSKRSEDNPYNIQYNSILNIFNDKETHLKSDQNFARDYFQRDFIKLGLLNCEPNDIILVSDLDEIPHPEIVKSIVNNKQVNHVVLMDSHNFYINNLQQTNWFGTFSIYYSDINGFALSRLREKSSKEFIRIDNGGWHLSFMGGADRIKEKIKCYSHQEYNNDWVLSSIEDKISSNVDLFGRSNNFYSNGIQEFYFNGFKEIKLEEYSYPTKMIELIKNKFPYLIK
jgi:beta-1,4-mannosyl-glycoprotein beta-1,4-N-acetylglucosaminyltransferase